MVKFSFIAAGLASILASPGCVEPNPDFLIGQLIDHLNDIDGDFEPPLEQRLEEQYDIQILGERELISEPNLLEIERVIGNLYRPDQIAGLTFVLGDDGLPDGNWGGSYHGRDTSYGPAVFIVNPSSPTTAHEVGHFLHYSIPQADREGFNQEWHNVKVTILDKEGQPIEVTTKDILRMVNIHDNYDALEFDIEGVAPLFYWGIFGFVKPYGHGLNGSDPERRHNAEDVATYVQFISQAAKSDQERDLQKRFDIIAYWDALFDITPYLEKLDLIKQYRLLDPEVIEQARRELQEKSDYFAPYRDFGALTDRITGIPDPALCPVVWSNLHSDGFFRQYQAYPDATISVEADTRGENLMITVRYTQNEQLLASVNFLYDPEKGNLEYLHPFVEEETLFVQDQQPDPDAVLEKRVDNTKWEKHILDKIQAFKNDLVVTVYQP
ncbi:hypothetical protein COV20_01740 [Candidatus Woesearchaeota archaeon CG10_big_fil_rev_8_21_14_0_10_45_16]|nr:MAG: hypothetical protein COV20_01740 [Candidatus Woesearchaeota archaeon CG10_big_fil_rev_8_21_14_0_10_45_16]